MFSFYFEVVWGGGGFIQAYTTYIVHFRCYKPIILSTAMPGQINNFPDFTIKRVGVFIVLVFADFPDSVELH
jgi:hypothetical protein